MNKIPFALITFLLLIPQAVFAHATPIEMSPRSGAQLPHPTNTVSITFSEHLESGSSQIRVANEKGVRAETTAASVAADGRTLSVPVVLSDGLYTVSWSVVSKDDGHFTRGSYAFAIGSSTVSASASEEMVKIATTKEASLMFVEFLGNSLLWGALALFLLSGADTRMRRPLRLLALLAVLCAAVGDIGQIVLKSHELAGLHESGFRESLRLYLHTTAGSSTLIRGVALMIGGSIAALIGFKTRLVSALILIPALCVFAYFRAIVSHATANPFHPLLSIVVNFVHVIEKDLWFGILLVLCALFVVRSNVARDHAYAVVNLLSANLAVLAASAGYIVWLHLRSFGNLASSAWGDAAVPLIAAALALIAIHSVIVFILRFRARLVPRMFVTLIGAETMAAALVVFFTSIVIITSPPSTAADPVVLSADSNGVHIELSRDRFEDGKALLTIDGSDRMPTVMIGDRDGGLLVPLSKRFEGGYVFPSGLITKPDHVSVIVAQERSYSADVTFDVAPADFAAQSGHGRRMDVFTISMIALVLCGVLYSIFLTFLGRGLSRSELSERHRTAAIVVGAVAAYMVVSILCIAATHVLANRFQGACEYDANMWHMMQPTKAGVPVAEGAQEGCMWGMGRQVYFFADAREYAYLGSLGEADVTMTQDKKSPRAGEPVTLTFSLKNQDGTPATLLYDMEKLLHVVVISADESVFAHIHPDDAGPMPQDWIDTSTFSVRYTFPKAGTYLISTDYAHGTKLESKQFRVTVAGSHGQTAEPRTYPSPGTFAGYEVTMDHGGAFAGEVTTLKFNVSKNGSPVTNMEPYLSAISHVSVVKNDLSAFVHTHGEIHPAGVPYPPVIVRNGVIVHSMASMEAPAHFGPSFEAHVLFPSSGRYTVWAQIKINGVVIPTSFTVDVE